jgi:hypothetical protein
MLITSALIEAVIVERSILLVDFPEWDEHCQSPNCLLNYNFTPFKTLVLMPVNSPP